MRSCSTARHFDSCDDSCRFECQIHLGSNPKFESLFLILPLVKLSVDRGGIYAGYDSEIGIRTLAKVQQKRVQLGAFLNEVGSIESNPYQYITEGLDLGGFLVGGIN